jgi:hypothetical protein
LIISNAKGKIPYQFNFQTFCNKMYLRKYKRWLLTFTICAFVCNLIAQVPKKFSFQGIARDATWKPIASSNINLRFSIREGSTLGAVVYQETGMAPTNFLGVFDYAIGTNPPGNIPDLLGDAASWKKGSYFLQVEMDAGGGSNFTNLGTTQLYSVPYAFFSEESGRWKNNDPVIQTGGLGTGNVLPNLSPGVKMVWYPRKAAFRTGRLVADEWSDANIGNFSVAMGNACSASGISSIAMGESASAKAPNSIAFGAYNDISDNPTGQNPDDHRLFQIGNGTSDAPRNALTILRDGRTGIGSNVLDPHYLLDIGGRIRIKHNVKTAGIYFNNSDNDEEGFVGMKTDDEIGFFIAGGWRFWVNNQGNGFLNGNIVQTSDYRLKRDFSILTNSLSKLSNLNGQHYFWKDRTKSQERQTGLIAQEVEQYFPELVTTDEKGFKAVNYIGLIPHLIESVKTLKKQADQIVFLSKRLELLEVQVAEGGSGTYQKALTGSAARPIRKHPK